MGPTVNGHTSRSRGKEASRSRGRRRSRSRRRDDAKRSRSRDRKERRRENDSSSSSDGRKRRKRGRDDRNRSNSKGRKADGSTSQAAPSIVLAASAPQASMVEDAADAALMMAMRGRSARPSASAGGVQQSFRLPPPAPLLAMPAEFKTSDQAGVSEFEAVFDRSNGLKLGVNIAMDGSSLLISKANELAVGEGAVAMWNRDNPGKAVQVGDRIVAVDGKKGDANWLVVQVQKFKKIYATIQQGSKAASTVRALERERLGGEAAIASGVQAKVTAASMSGFSGPAALRQVAAETPRTASVPSLDKRPSLTTTRPGPDKVLQMIAAQSTKKPSSAIDGSGASASETSQKAVSSSSQKVTALLNKGEPPEAKKLSEYKKKVEDLNKIKKDVEAASTASVGGSSASRSSASSRSAPGAAQKDSATLTREERVKQAVADAVKQRKEVVVQKKVVKPTFSLYDDLLPAPDPEKDELAKRNAAAGKVNIPNVMEAPYVEDRTKVIFLDIDGVMRPLVGSAFVISTVSMDGETVPVVDDASDFLPSAMVALQHILAKTGAIIVLSSEWRRHPTLRDGISTALRKRGMPAIFDETPRHERELRGDPKRTFIERRAREIGSWLSEHPDVRFWVVLDDIDIGIADENRKSGQPYIAPKLVQTDDQRCLTLEDARLSVQILNGKQLDRKVEATTIPD